MKGVCGGRTQKKKGGGGRGRDRRGCTKIKGEEWKENKNEEQKFDNRAQGGGGGRQAHGNFFIITLNSLAILEPRIRKIKKKSNGQKKMKFYDSSLILEEFSCRIIQRFVCVS